MLDFHWLQGALKGFDVVGFDINQERIKQLNNRTDINNIYPVKI